MSAVKGTSVVRVSELARASSVSVATIKYYIREGLLPAGELTAPNQADYGERHLDRLRLIRALRDVAGLSIDAIAQIVAALDRGDSQGVEGLLGHCDLPRLAGVEETVGEDALAEAQAEIDRLLQRLHWDVGAHSPARIELARVLAMLREFWDRRMGADTFLAYAEPVQAIVDFERGVLRHGEATTGLRPLDPARPEDAMRILMLGSILFGRAVLALRGLAHENRARREAAAGAVQ